MSEVSTKTKVAEKSPSSQPENSQVLVQEFGQSLLTKLGMLVFRLIRNAILARVLGPADRGLFSLISNLPELIMVAGNAGLSNAASYNVAKQTGSLSRILANVNAQILILSVILFAASFWLIEQPWLVADYEGTIVTFRWLIACAIPLMLLKVVNINLLNVLHRISVVNRFSIMESMIPLILFFVFWLGLGLSPLLAAVWSWFCGLLLLAVGSTFILNDRFAVRLDRDLQGNLISFGGRGYLDTLFQKMLLRLDFIFVSNMLGHEALGYYAMATAAAELMLTIPNSLAVSLFSFLLKNGSEDKNAVTPIVLRLLIFIMVIGAILFAILGKVLIYIMFGAAFLPAYTPLLALLPGVVCISYATLIRLDLIGHDMPGTISLVLGAALLVNIILNLVLIPDIGVVGAAVASSFAYFVAAMGLYRVHKKTTGLSAQETLFVRIQDIKLVLEYVRFQFNSSQKKASRSSEQREVQGEQN